MDRRGEEEVSGLSEGEPSARPPQPSAIADIFGLSQEEDALVEDFCTEALAERGIDGRRFFAALRRGEDFQAALGLTPAVLDALYARAHRWFAVGYPGRAEPLFRALCVAAPSSADHWAGLGICLRIADERPPAEMAFRTASRLRPDWAVPDFHLCELAILNEDLPKARHHLDAFFRLSDAQTPAAMKAEALRLEQAIASRGRA